MPRPARSRSTALAASLVTALSLAMVPQLGAPAVAAPPTKGSLVASPTHAPPGAKVTLTGRAGPRSAHAVRLQVARTGTWSTVQAGRTARTGKFRFVVTLPSGVASQRYRVLTPRSRTVPPSVTPTVTVGVDADAVRWITRDDDLDHYLGVVSGDGRYLLDGDAGAARLRDLTTGAVTEITVPGRAVDLSDDGGVVLLQGAGGPFVWHRSTGAVVALDPSLAAGWAWSISGDGTTVLVAVYDGQGGVQGLYVEDLATGVVTTVPGLGSGGDLSFDGRYVATAGADGERVVDLETGTAVDLTPVGARITGYPSISDDGRFVTAWLSMSGGAANVWVWDVTTGESEVSPLGPDTYGENPRISADGRRIVFGDSNRDSTITNPVLWDRLRGDVRALTSSADVGTYGTATISDAGRLASVLTNVAVDPADTDGQPDLYLYDLDRLS